VVRITCARWKAALAGMLCLGLWVPAFSQGLGYNVRGELKSASPRMFSEYMVQLVDPTHRNTFSRVEVRNDGTFEIRNLPTGDYTVLVTTLHGEPVHETTVSISPHSTIEVRLPGEAPIRPGASTVSARQLLHPPTKKAYHSFVEAQKFSSSGDYAKAAEALQRALQESPEYAEAHVNLGVQYIRTGRYDAAAAELTRAMEISGPNAVILCDLAWVQLRLGHRDKAVENVRAGLKMDPGSAQGNLILGNLLAGDPRTRAEAIQHLEKAAETLSSARALLAQIQSIQDQQR
jgi:tetratricopeptide (TPR) repeat protein